jgi:hypothetical protein
MTGEQADWLRKNRQYRATGRLASGSRYVKTGMLHVDGAFELHPPRGRAAVKQGSIEVGVLEAVGGMGQGAVRQ